MLFKTLCDYNKDTALLPMSTVVHPPKFTGHYDGDFEKWLVKFQWCACAMALTDERTAYLLPLYLTGVADSFCNRIEAAQAPGAPIYILAQWYDLLRTKYPAGRDSEIKEIELMHPVQKAGETVTEFATAIRDLVWSIYLTFTAAQCEAIAKTAFIQGLPIDIRRLAMVGVMQLLSYITLWIIFQKRVKLDIMFFNTDNMVSVISMVISADLPLDKVLILLKDELAQWFLGALWLTLICPGCSKAAKSVEKCQRHYFYWELADIETFKEAIEMEKICQPTEGIDIMNAQEAFLQYNKMMIEK